MFGRIWIFAIRLIHKVGYSPEMAFIQSCNSLLLFLLILTILDPIVCSLSNVDKVHGLARRRAEILRFVFEISQKYSRANLLRRRSWW